MLFDSRLGQVVYVNGAGHAWAWDGSGWGQLALPSGPSIPIPGSGTQILTFVAGYDEARDLLAFVLSSTTWLWDGSSWKVVPVGIDSCEARADASGVPLSFGEARVVMILFPSAASFPACGVSISPSGTDGPAGGEVSCGGFRVPQTSFEERQRVVHTISNDVTSCYRHAHEISRFRPTRDR